MSPSGTSTTDDTEHEDAAPRRYFNEWSQLSLRMEIVWKFSWFVGYRDAKLVKGCNLYLAPTGSRQLACLNLEEQSSIPIPLPPMPTGRERNSTVFVGDTVVWIGGETGQVVCYDTVTRARRSLSSLQLVPDNMVVVALNEAEFLVCDAKPSSARQLTFEKYNINQGGTSETFSLLLERDHYLLDAVLVNDQKVLAFLNARACVLIDLSTHELESMPDMYTIEEFEYMIGQTMIDSFVVVALKRKYDYEGFEADEVFFRLLDMQRVDLGWRIIRGLDQKWVISFGDFAKWVQFVDEDKCLYVATEDYVKRVDLSAAFQTGTLRYKAVLPQVIRREVSDSEVSLAMALGGTDDDVHVSYIFDILHARPDLFEHADLHYLRSGLLTLGDRW